MGLLWWIIPAITFVAGLLLSFAGLGRLLKLRLAAGGVRFLFGIVFLVSSIGIGFAGLNLQTYKRLTKERIVAEISFEKVAGSEDTYTVNLELEDGKLVRETGFVGDQFQLSARVIRFAPMEQLLGYDSLYRLEMMESRLSNRYNAETVSQAVSYGIRLHEQTGLDVYGLLVKYSGEQEPDAVLQDEEGEGADDVLVSAGPLMSKDGKGSAPFGSAVYFPMADKLEYTVKITQSALVVEPGNAAARKALNSGE
ncbi:MAG: hypothetical protein GYB42_11035 [Alphaproteobacteria bacterium]|nr:hypothetical protein [Alphaproteobacteria bacterium]